MDVVFFTQNPQNLSGVDCLTQNPQKSQNLLGCIFFTQNPQNLLDAKFASHRDSYNSADSACLKKASHRDSQNSAHSACNNNITSP